MNHDDLFSNLQTCQSRIARAQQRLRLRMADIDQRREEITREHARLLASNTPAPPELLQASSSLDREEEELLNKAEAFLQQQDTTFSQALAALGVK